MKKQNKDNKTKKTQSNSRAGRSGNSNRTKQAQGRQGGRRNINSDSRFLGGESVCGILEGNAKGFAFLIRDDKGSDVFISPNSLGGAVHGDRVRANVISKQGGREEGSVTEILQPTERILIGVYVNTSGRAIVIPDEKKISMDIEIEKKNSLNASNGDRVLVKITQRKGAVQGKITRVFNESDKIDWDVFSVLIAHNIKNEFSEQVTRETEKLPNAILEDELKNRQDFRDILSITIDGDDSKDFDDAISLAKKKDGYELIVHIADVSHYVRVGTHLDKEAFARGTSIYFPGSFVPMLPEKICNNLCSLMENHDRLTLSVIMQIDMSGRVTKNKIVSGVIRSKRRMTYSRVEKILNGEEPISSEYSDIAPMLHQMKELALILNRRRKERGSVDFDLPECEILLDEDGTVSDIRRAGRLTSHRIIEEFMLITNETVAEFMQKQDAPFVYRGHLPPNDLKMETFTEFLGAIGLAWHKSEPVVPMDYSKLLASLPENLSNIVNMMALRSMTKAAYFPQNKGHFGLASEFYCHFTAPIRRYPDLIIHRIIKDYLSNGKKCFPKYTEAVIEASTQSSLTERQADEVERDIEDIYKARYMSGKIGECYEGIISGITEWGIYVQLENTVEGMIKRENLDGGDYFYNPILMSLSNMSHIYKPGEKIKIKVLSTTKNKIEFGLNLN